MKTELHDFEEKRVYLRKNKNFYDYSENNNEYDLFDTGIDEEYEFFSGIEY